MNDRFQFLKSYADVIQKVAQSDNRLAGALALKIINYGIYGIDEECGDPMMEALFMQIKIMIDKGLEITGKNLENGKKGGRPKNPNKTQTKPNNNPNETETEPKKTKIENRKDKIENRKDKIENNLNILSNDNIETEVSGYGKNEINELIFLLKQEANSLGIAYDTTKERYFANFILTAKEFGNFCEKIGQKRVECAINIMKASIHINYWKGICSGPMKIYQNYSDVYNETLKFKNKNSKNLIQSF